MKDDALILGGTDFLRIGGHFVPRPSVIEMTLRPEAHGGAHRVHRGIAAPDDKDGLARKIEGFSRRDGTQKSDPVDRARTFLIFCTRTRRM